MESKLNNLTRPLYKYLEFIPQWFLTQAWNKSGSFLLNRVNIEYRFIWAYNNA